MLGLPLTVFGTGKQTRCFCHVSDAVEAMTRLVGSDRAVGEVVNIGSVEETSVEQLAYLVKERAQSSSPIRGIPYDEAYEPGFEDMPRRVPSLEKLERLTGFRPTIPLAQTVDEVMDYVVRKRKKRELVAAQQEVRRRQAPYAG